MKRTILKEIPSCIPNKFLPLIYGADIYDSSCSPEARVYYIDRDGGYYLKRAALGTLSAEAEMTRYFHNIGIGVEVISKSTSWLYRLACFKMRDLWVTAQLYHRSVYMESGTGTV